MNDKNCLVDQNQFDCYNQNSNFSLAKFTYSTGNEKLFRRCITKIVELNQTGKILISSVRENIKILNLQNQNTELKLRFCFFSLNEKKDVLIAYDIGLCCYSLSHSKIINCHDCLDSCIVALTQIEEKYVAMAFSGKNHIQIDAWTNYTTEKRDHRYQLLVGHSEFINCLCAVKNDHLISGSNDQTLKYWKISTLECIYTFIGHSDSVTCIEIMANKEKFLSGSSDRTVKLWSLNTGDCSKTFNGHQSQINQIQLCQDEICFLSLSNDGILKQWNLETGQCMHTMDDNKYDRISSFTIFKTGNLVTGSRNGRIKIWSTNENKIEKGQLNERKLKNNFCNLI